MDYLLDLIVPFVFLVLIWGLYRIFKVRYADNKLVAILTHPTTLYLLLVSWSILGFITKLDYNTHWGCVIFTEPIFSKANIMYSGLALGLISLGAHIPKQRVGTIILYVELLIWLYKLFLVKGGYAVGIGGLPLFEVLWFDTIALTLRLILLNQVGRLHFKTVWIFAVVFIIMVVRIQYFP